MNALPMAEDRLSRLGIRTILIANALKTNMTAAVAASRTLQSVQFQFFDHSEDAISALRSEDGRHMLVISDLSVGSPDSGLRILAEALAHNAPAFIATAGELLGGTPCVRLMPGFEIHRTLIGKMDDPSMWNKILHAFYSESFRNKGFWSSVIGVWKSGLPIGSVVAAEMQRMIREERNTPHRPLASPAPLFPMAAAS